MSELFKNIQGDKKIWLLSCCLAIISILAVYSSVSALAFKQRDGLPEQIILKHGIIMLVGFALMYVIHRVRFTYFSKISVLLMWLSAGLLLFTLLKGSSINNANRWLIIPGINQSFQTSDLAKIVLIVFLSRMLAMRKEFIEDYRRVLIPASGAVALICGLILPANFSTAALLGAVCFLLMFIAGVPLKQLSVLVISAGVGFFMLIQIAGSYPDVLPRMATWKSRIENFGSAKSETNYQVEHAKYAIANGGLLPNGPGKGASRNFLPHPYSDMIYAFIIEEYGSIIGGVGLVLLYLILLLRSIKIATRCEKPFGAYVVTGLSMLIVFQALTNMAVATNVIPVTGQPLPLVSLGGTSTLFTCLAIGMILSVSRSVYDEDNPSKNQFKKEYGVA
ncbi:FtsW/RodA/SpoVE family cell cycle protein [Luteibaculum oceani]|uniref:Probable peptidoglycan glycosyltransferase FtsW n=1 Tax=Luteibaculum oceani TaxID=1294296 RepID=A0A5C6V5G7_9FLAO|nr:FtsW/RodA/SpoVE family cell cycle protein [Luteibaculum oceani]TXC78875.1 cell division protein FtsW [Luteibaculum oceani]